jgi:hypothetical protein
LQAQTSIDVPSRFQTAAGCGLQATDELKAKVFLTASGTSKLRIKQVKYLMFTVARASEGHKSVAVRERYGSSEKTLNDDEIGSCIPSFETLVNKLNVSIR